MVRYNRINAKLSDSQLNKLKSAVKDQAGLTLRMNVRMFNGNNLPHEGKKLKKCQLPNVK